MKYRVLGLFTSRMFVLLSCHEMNEVVRNFAQADTQRAEFVAFGLNMIKNAN